MRTTSDPKEKNIKLRISDDLKSYVDRASSMRHMSVSEYIRDLIRRDMRNKTDTT